MSALDDLRFAAIAIEEGRRTLLCHPDNEAAVRAAMPSEFYEVAVNPFCPPDKVFVIDRNAVEAGVNEARQHGVHFGRIDL